MTLVPLIALAVSAVLVVASSAVAVVHGLRAWRSFRALGRAAGEALDELARHAEATERRAEAATGGASRVADAVARLQESLADLAVLNAAAGEARSIYAGLHGVVPHK